MKIQVQLFATLSRYLPDSAGDHGLPLEVPDGSTIRDVADTLGISGEVPTIALVNGRDASSEQVLKAGDTLTMFPPLAGGCMGLRAAEREWVGNRLTVSNVSWAQ